MKKRLPGGKEVGVCLADLVHECTTPSVWPGFAHSSVLPHCAPQERYFLQRAGVKMPQPFRIAWRDLADSAFLYTEHSREREWPTTLKYRENLK